MKHIRKITFTSAFVLFSHSAFAVPAHDASGLAQKIKDLAADAVEYAEKAGLLKKQLESRQEAFENNLKKDMDQAVAGAAIAGESRQKLSQLEFLKETADVGHEACAAVAAQAGSADAICGEVNRIKVENVKSQKLALSQAQNMLSNDDRTASERLKKHLALKSRADKRLLDRLEADMGLGYREDFSRKSGLGHRGLVNTSVFFMSDGGFDEKYAQQSSDVINLIANNQDIEFVDKNKKGSMNEIANAMAEHAISNIATKSLRRVASYHQRGSDGMSPAELDNMLSHQATSKDDLMNLIANAPSIDMLPRMQLIHLAHDADLALRRYKSSLQREAMLAARLAEKASLR